MTWLFLRMVLLITVVFLLANGAKAKRKDDVVTMKNGDSFTGKIKELERGELVFKSDRTGRLCWRSGVPPYFP